uniref:Uncharacterized protein n=1 Tax=Oryza barthii TaxID=65489 RepID=A0A0D3HJ44_9ORYZ
MFDEMLTSSRRSNQRTWQSSPIRELKNDAHAATTPCRAPPPPPEDTMKRRKGRRRTRWRVATGKGTELAATASTCEAVTRRGSGGGAALPPQLRAPKPQPPPHHARALALLAAASTRTRRSSRRLGRAATAGSNAAAATERGEGNRHVTRHTPLPSPNRLDPKPT